MMQHLYLLFYIWQEQEAFDDDDQDDEEDDDDDDDDNDDDADDDDDDANISYFIVSAHLDSSCSSSDTHRVNLVTNPVISCV
jgi:TATA-binding protein-associated factor Taf7